MGNAARRNRVETDQATLRDLASEVEWAKVSNVRPDDYAARRGRPRARSVTGHEPDGVARVFATYEEVKRDQGRMDMEDVLLCAAALLAEDERVAAEVRRQYHWFVVDEFQDVSPIQSALLDLWLGGRDDLCVVGDPAQTIYSFAGANASLPHRVPPSLPERTTCDRAGPQLPLDPAGDRRLPTACSPARPAPACSCARSATAGPEVRFSEHSDEVAEAEQVAADILGSPGPGVPPREIAVLFRINAQSEAFEEALAARGVPYVVRGAARFFERPEVRQAVTLLRGQRAGATAARRDGTRRPRSAPCWPAWAGHPRRRPARGNVRDRWESLQALVSQAEDCRGRPGDAALADFVAELDRRAAEQHAPVAEGVTLATLHAAKGLEWDAVFLGGMHEGTMPIIYAEGPAAVEEERRLLYVGMTRARRHLAVSWSLARNPGVPVEPQAVAVPRRSAPAGAAPTCAESRARQPQAQGRRQLPQLRQAAGAAPPSARSGRCEDCPATYDEELFERLRTWRVERAAEEKVPAYVVFTDLTLQAIAEVKPADRRRPAAGSAASARPS